MAIPIIYTGQNVGTPIRTGQALQAASHYSQSEQQRKQDEVQLAYKERDNFLNLLKSDPVYTASTKANEIMAREADQFVNATADLYAKNQGKLPTGEIVKIQQHKNAMLAHQDYLKSINDEMLKVRQVMSANPGRLDEEWFNNAVDQFSKTGTYPTQGFASPAYQDTVDIWQKDESLPFEWTTIASGTDAQGNTLYKNIKDFSKITPEQRIQRASDMYDNDVSGVKLNSWKKFGKLTDEEQQQWSKKAQEMGINDPVKAYAINEGQQNLGMNESAKGTLRGSGGGLSFIFGGGGIYDKDKNPIVTPQDAISTANLGTDKGLKFTVKTPTMEVPSNIGKLMYNGQELKLADSTSLRVQGSSVLGDQVEYNLPSTENIEVIILGKRGQVPKGFERVPGSSADANGNIQWKGRVPSGATFVSPVSQSMAYIDPNLGGKFKEAYTQYYSQYEKDHINNKYKTTISDTVYTYKELKDNGWTDADIRKLTLVKQ